MTEQSLEERVAQLEEVVAKVAAAHEDPNVINQFEIVKTTVRMTEAEGPGKHVEVEFSRPVKAAYALMQGWELSWGDHGGLPVHTAQVFCNDAEPRAYDPTRVGFTVNLWWFEDDHHRRGAHGGWKGAFFIAVLGVIA